MYKRILVATDGSELAGKAVDQGIILAKALGSEVTFVSVTEMWSAMEMASDIELGKTDAIDAYEKAAAATAQKILDAAKEKAEAEGLSAHVRHVRDRKPAEGILQTADLEDCDLIVMASHGRRGLQKVLLGSQTAEVLALTTRAVLVLR